MHGMEGLLIPDPMFYVLAVPVVLLVGIGKGGFGGGIGMVAVPALSFVVPLPLAAAVLLPILCVMDLFAVAAYRGKYSGVNLRRLIPSAIVGIGLGALAFGALDERWLRVIVGLIAITFSVQWLVGLARHRGRAPEPRSPGGWPPGSRAPWPTPGGLRRPSTCCPSASTRRSTWGPR
jgi:hypothetical protein